MFESACEGEEEEEDGAFGPFADAYCSRGYGEHEEVYIDLAGPDLFEDLVCGFPCPCKVGEGEGC